MKTFVTDKKTSVIIILKSIKKKIELAEYFFIKCHSRACKLRMLTNLAGNGSDVDGYSIQFSNNQFMFTF